MNPLCTCGCGQETKINKQTKVPNKYIFGHQNRGKPHSKEHKQKLRELNTGKNNPNYGKIRSETTRKKQSATQQGIPYEEWENYATNQPYCPAFNESCKESNREKYGRKCFICGIPESENITSTGKFQKLSVHHIDMDKNQGCDGKRWRLVPTCMWHHMHSDEWMYRIIYLLENVWG